MVYLFTLYLSLFGPPSSLLRHSPSSLRLAFFVPPCEPWPEISDAFSLSCFIPEFLLYLVLFLNWYKMIK